MKEEDNMKLKIIANKYMEKTYGKKWRERLEMSSPAITNAFIDGYRYKESEEKTAKKVIYNRNMIDIMEPQRETIEKKLRLKVEVKEFMPNNLIVICDDDLNVLLFIDLNKKD